jgi:penicillin-binding protein 1A
MPYLDAARSARTLEGMASTAPPRAGRVPSARPGAPGGVPRRPSPAARRRRRSRRLARVFLVLVLAVTVSATSFVTGLLAVPFDVRAVPPAPKSVLLLDEDGRQFAQMRPPQRREVISAEDIPDIMRKAIISAEDARFLDHKGVDPVATVRAAYRDLTGGRRQGGSTLTQQYVKNVYVGNDRTLLRKIKEAGLAVRLENRKSKEEILTDYLNVLYLGNNVYGVQAASKYYFGVDVKDLNLDETPGRGLPRDEGLALARASMLAGIAPAPSAWNPVKDFTTARIRQRYTLNQMVLNGHITSEMASDAFKRAAAVKPLQETPPEPPTTAPEFADLVKGQLRAEYKDDEDALYRGGLRVTTTLNSELQEAVTRAAREVLPDPDDPQAAVVAIDITNGDVKAMTTLRRQPAKGDRPALDGYQRDGYNLATNAHRSTGSTLKPFILAEALKDGYSLNQRRRAPARDSIPNPGGRPNPYVYGNAGDSGYSGSLTLRQALKKSVNTVFVPLANEVGREDVAQLLLASGAKPDPKFPIKSGNLSFGLGAGVEVTPLSMASAFATLMNHGLHMKPRYVRTTKTADGAVVEDAPVKPDPVRRAMPAEVADQVVEAMSGVTEPGGTATRARQAFTVYGKTGTTNDSTDAWFIGCARSPQNLCIATWMGYDDQTCDGISTRNCGGMKNVNGVKQVYGGTLPAEIFDRTFEILREIQADRVRAAAGEPPVEPSEPVSVPDAEPAGDQDAEPEPAAPAEEPAEQPAEQPAEEPPPAEPEQTTAPEPRESPSTQLPPPGGGGGGSAPDPEQSPQGADPPG